jgi:hypothetical protein
LNSQGSNFGQIVPADVESADTHHFSIPSGDKKVSQMIVELAQGPGENFPPGRIEFDQALNLFCILQLGFSDHRVILVSVTVSRVRGKDKMIIIISVVSLTLLYNHPRVVIPAKAGIQFEKTGFRIKSGMTLCVKSFLRQYTRLISKNKPQISG